MRVRWARRGSLGLRAPARQTWDRKRSPLGTWELKNVLMSPKTPSLDQLAPEAMQHGEVWKRGKGKGKGRKGGREERKKEGREEDVCKVAQPLEDRAQ